MKLQMENINKSFTEPDGSKLQVLNDIDLTVDEGEFFTIMGPSGCGKSTLLNIIAGVLQPDSGTIKHNGKEIKAGDLPFGYVFQEPRLLDWRTVGQNIKFAMRAQGIPAEKHEEQIEKWLKRVNLEGQEDNYPLRLSGGMKQRVGLARALAVDPEMILMDEPFSSLDEITARELRDDLVDLMQEEQREVIFVTHNIREGVYLSDRIAFINDGEIFNIESIDLPRPRDVNSPELIELESRLTREFFEEIQ